MAVLIAFALTAAVGVGALPSAGEQHGAKVRAVATVTILRAERASESAEPGGLTRHVSRRGDGSVSIAFE